MGIALDLQVKLGRSDIIIFSLLSHEALQLFRCCLISFTSVFSFQHADFAHLKNLYLNISFWGALFVYLFFISKSNSSLLVQKNAVDFCLLVMNLMICCIHVLVLELLCRFFGIFYVEIILSVNGERLIFSPLILLVLLCSMARTFCVGLNTSGGRGHPCLVPDLRGQRSLFKERMAKNFCF